MPNELEAYLTAANASTAAPQPSAPAPQRDQILGVLMQMSPEEVLALFREYIAQTGGQTAPDFGASPSAVPSAPGAPARPAPAEMLSM